MKLKSFFAESIEEAIGLARREMGPDAMLVHSKRSGAEARHLGAYEVVCAADTHPETEGRHSDPAQPSADQPVEKLVREVSDLRQQMERLSRSLTRCGSGVSALAADPDLAAAFAELTEAEVDADLVYEIVTRINLPFTEALLRDQLRRFVRVDAELGCEDAERQIVAFVGPPGAGKTSALVKLAVHYGISARKRVQFLSLDTYRIAAAQELQSYAAILGTGCQVLESSAALAQALVEHSRANLILIDTPGLSRNDMDEDLARTLAAAPDIDRHLVLPASMRASDMKRAADQYALFKPDKLLFTRLDETQTFGQIVSQSVRMALPVSFLSMGQHIPEDLEAASEDRLLGLLLKSEPAQEPKCGMVAA